LKRISSKFYFRRKKVRKYFLKPSHLKPNEFVLCSELRDIQKNFVTFHILHYLLGFVVIFNFE
jgi:hypothetical protein